MTLVKRTFFTVITLFVIAIITLLLVSNLLVFNSFSKLEENNISKNLTIILNLMNMELENLNSACINYSNNANIRETLESNDKDTNLVQLNTSSILSEYRANFGIILDSNYNIIGSAGYDSLERRIIPASNLLVAQLLSIKSLASHSNTESFVKGFYNTIHGPIMIVSRPILSSTNDTVIGTAIIGRYISSYEMTFLSKTVKISTRMCDYNDPLNTIDLLNAKKYLSRSSPIYINPLNAHTIAGYILLNDISSTPSLIIKMDSDREMYDQGKTTVKYFTYLLVIVGLILIVMVLLLIKKTIIERVTKLSDTTEIITASGDLTLRMHDMGKDELTNLAFSINTMLDSLQKAQHEITKSEYKYRSLFANMQEGFMYNQIITDENGEPTDFIIHDVNDAFFNMFDTIHSKQEIKGNTISKLNNELYLSIHNSLATYGKIALKTNHSITDELYMDYYKKWYSISVYSTERGYFAVIFTDITKIKEAEQKMIYQVYHDSLTNLPNRKHLLERLEKLIETSKVFGYKFSVIFIDLNNFKLVNDIFGHNAGDDLLKKVSSKLSNVIRKDDLVARMGGDEFIIVQMSINSDEDAKKLAIRVLQSLKFTYSTNEETIEVSASLGISIFPSDSENIDSLIKKADTAMYEAKKSDDLLKMRFYKKEAE